jgi:hypothetical protein
MEEYDMKERKTIKTKNKSVEFIAVPDEFNEIKIGDLLEDHSRIIKKFGKTCLIETLTGERQLVNLYKLHGAWQAFDIIKIWDTIDGIPVTLYSKVKYPGGRVVVSAEVE